STAGGSPASSRASRSSAAARASSTSSGPASSSSNTRAAARTSTPYFGGCWAGNAPPALSPIAALRGDKAVPLTSEGDRSGVLERAARCTSRTGGAKRLRAGRGEPRHRLLSPVEATREKAYAVVLVP